MLSVDVLVLKVRDTERAHASMAMLLHIQCVLQRHCPTANATIALRIVKRSDERSARKPKKNTTKPRSSADEAPHTSTEGPSESYLLINFISAMTVKLALGWDEAFYFLDSINFVL